MSLIAGLAAAIRAGLRPMVVCALIGAGAGILWGLADEPVYGTEATVLISDRGDAVETVGAGAIGSGDAGSAERLLALARSQEVAGVAAENLGGDVSGADVLSRTTFSIGPDGGTLIVRSTAGFADFAAAAANAYADAVVSEADRIEKRRLERLRSNIEEDLAAVDPASEEGIALSDRLAAVAALEDAGDPLAPGAEATLPDAPESDRSASRTGLLGLGLGALVAIVFLLAGELRRRPIRTSRQLAVLTGAEPLGILGRGDGVSETARPGVFEIEPLLADRAHRVERALGFDGAGAPATLAVASPMPGEGRTTVALGIAAAAAADGLSVLLMETDMRRPALASILGLAEGPGLSDYMAGAATPREVINAIPVARGAGSAELPSFVCVTAGTRTEAPAAMLASGRFDKLNEQLRRVYDLVVFDTPALLPAPEAILVCETTDATVVCVRSGLTRRRELVEAQAMLDPERLAGTVLTAAPGHGPGTRRLAIPRGSRFAEPRIRR